MSSRNLLRTVDVFFEYGGPFAVDRGLAGHLADNGFRQLTKTAGTLDRPIVPGSLKGLRIPTETNPILATSIRLPTASPHTLLLTRRLLRNPGSDDPLIGIRAGHTDYERDGKLMVTTRMTVSVFPPELDPLGIGAINTLRHEGGHSLGILGECALQTCVMHEAVGKQQVEPFCDGCTETIKAQGQLIQAQY
jgi:hypothetical protein